MQAVFALLFLLAFFCIPIVTGRFLGKTVMHRLPEWVNFVVVLAGFAAILALLPFMPAQPDQENYLILFMYSAFGWMLFGMTTQIGRRTTEDQQAKEDSLSTQPEPLPKAPVAVPSDTPVDDSEEFADLKNKKVVPMKCAKAVVIKVEYKEVERFINDVFGHDFCFRTDQEAGNDSEHEFTVSSEPDRDNQDRVKHYIEDGSGIFMTSVLLNFLASIGKIETGTYLISVSW